MSKQKKGIKQFMRMLRQKTLTKQYVTTVVLCTVMVTGLTACQKSIEPTKNQPAKLVQISQGKNVLNQILSSNITSDKSLKGKKDKEFSQTTSSFQVLADSQGYVTATPDGKVVALNSQGKQLWQVNFKQGLVSGVSTNAQGNIVLVSDKKANLMALDRASGKQRWKTTLTGTLLAPSLISQNRVISLSNDGIISGLSLQTGESIWQFTTQVPAISLRGSASPIAINDKTTLVATPDGRIHALNSDNGLPLWSRRISLVKGSSEIERLADIDATPLFSDNMLYVITYSGQLVGIDMAGQQISFLENYASLKSVMADSQQLYVTTLAGDVLALDKFTGKINWKTESLAYRGLSNPIVTKDYVIVGDAEGYLHVLAKNTGQPVDRKKMSNNVANLRLVNNQLIAQSQAGNFSVWQIN